MTTVENSDRVVVSVGDGRVLEVLVSGPPEGPVLVFHAGTPAGLVPLPVQLDLAATGIRTVLYARPGYGHSTPHPGRTIADGAADTATILDALGVDSFLNVGYSGGGPYALACDALLADRCLATAVVAGIAPYNGGSSQVRGWYEADEDNQLALAGDIEGFRQAVDGFVHQLRQAKAETIAADAASDAERQFFAQGYAEWVASFLRAAGVSGSDGVVEDCLASFGDWAFPLASVRHVTIWHGTEDRHVPLLHGEWLRDHLPRADLRSMEGESHITIAGQIPTIVNALIAQSE